MTGEAEHKRKLTEIESDAGVRGSEAEREVKRQNHDEQTDQNMDQPGDDVRGTKKKAEGEGHQEEAKHTRRPVAERRDGMILVFLREQETTRLKRHEKLTNNGRYYLGSVEESDGKDETAAMFGQIEEDKAQEWLADACDDIDGSELDPACTGVGVVQEDARVREETATLRRKRGMT